MTRTRQKAGRFRAAGVPEGLYGPAGMSSAEVTVVFVMNRLMRPGHVGVAAPIAREAREIAASGKRQVMAQYPRASHKIPVECVTGASILAALGTCYERIRWRRLLPARPHRGPAM